MSQIDNINVMIIDDCVESQNLIRSILQKKGFNRFQHANDGLEALNLLEQNSQQGVNVDLILSDWRMPGMDGHRLLRNLKKGPHAHVPFIMTSVVDNPQEVYKVIQSGVSNYIIKPIKAQTLYRKVASALQLPSPKQSEIVPDKVKKQNGTAVRWNQLKHEIGNRVIDFQHQRIMEAIYDLNQPCDKRDEITEMFNRIKRCTLQHFEYEELQLKKLKCDLSSHLKSHQEFLEFLEEITLQHLNGRIKLNPNALLQLSYKFAEHIVEEDQADLLLLYRKKIN